MNTSPRPRIVVHLSLPKVPPASADTSVVDAAAENDSAPACGWYDSSFALRQGLVVSELPDNDGSVAALWFAALAPGRLQ